MAEGIIAYLLVVYCIVWYWKTRKLTVLFLAAILFSFQLPLWPFFLPSNAASVSLAGTAALFAFYDFYRKKDRLLLLYGLVLLYFAALYVVEMWMKAPH